MSGKSLRHSRHISSARLDMWLRRRRVKARKTEGSRKLCKKKELYDEELLKIWTDGQTDRTAVLMSVASVSVAVSAVPGGQAEYWNSSYCCII
jgi:hypothetical protein